MLDGRTNDDIAAIRARHRAADQNDFLRLAHLHDFEVLHGHALIAHVTGHAHVLPDASGSGTIANGAVAAMRLRAMRCALAMEVVLLHDALKTFALGAADHVDE